MGKQPKKTVTEIKEDLRKKYDARKVYGWSGYVDDPSEAAILTLMEDISADLGIIPSYFNTIAVGEGLNLFVDDNYDPKPPHHVIIDQPLSGFNVLGTDDFGSEFPRYKKYLPKTYNEGKTKADFKTGAEFIQEVRTNELGKKTISGIFKDLESALWAFGATLAHRQNLFLSHASSFAYGTPTEDQQAYWTYVYYQGEGNAKRWLKANKGFDITTNKSSRGQVHILATERLATWRYVQTKKIFSK
ncbi:hypothetical protein [Aquimarina sp. 2201CG14-23]|uniref:hypothetical protein n=1 Tax=Aquimarina mycalae TaxID=3040073 RepID=UPI0024780E9E|nr:hypothetical protein [Aquimarina sp. 2201CG14-23]MDH7446805.1 hypothetical protein [Aquimarina sp. 2201CG14-23]